MLQRIFVAVFLFASVHLLSAQASSAHGKPLPPGPMRAKIKAACTQCHNATRITEQHLTRQQWSDELDKMEGMGAVIRESDRNALLAYLAKNFGPGKAGEKTAVKKASSAAD